MFFWFHKHDKLFIETLTPLILYLQDLGSADDAMGGKNCVRTNRWESSCRHLNFEVFRYHKWNRTIANLLREVKVNDQWSTQQIPYYPTSMEDPGSYMMATTKPGTVIWASSIRHRLLMGSGASLDNGGFGSGETAPTSGRFFCHGNKYSRTHSLHDNCAKNVFMFYWTLLPYLSFTMLFRFCCDVSSLRQSIYDDWRVFP